LAFSTSYKLSDFFDGSQVPNTLHNIVMALQRRRTSYLAQAMATDIEVYEQNLEQPRGRVERAPDLIEVDLATSILMGQHELLQQIVHFTAANAPKKTGRPKVTRLPRPKTAQQLYEAAERRNALAHLESVITFVPQEQWEHNLENAQGGGE
jgi:hypothetical protein